MRAEYIERVEQDRVVELMCQILDLQDVSEKIVIQKVHDDGIRQFFEQYEELAIADEEKERITALKIMIETKEREILMMEGAE